MRQGPLIWAAGLGKGPLRKQCLGRKDECTSICPMPGAGSGLESVLSGRKDVHVILDTSENTALSRN